MSQLLQLAASPDVLGPAFERLFRAEGMWSNRVPMEVMRQYAPRHLLDLADGLRAGRHEPDRVRQFSVQKADGRERVLTVFSVRDRVAQRAVLTAVQPHGEALFLPCSYGFRPGLTVNMAYNRVREWIREGYHWLVDADIVSCFDHIRRSVALRLLRAVALDGAVAQLAARWVEAVAPSQGADGDCGLPQGMGLSPFLCNLYLHGFDLAMRRAGIPMVRYADDFVLLARTQRDAQLAMGFAAQRLQIAGLRLHPQKSRVIKSGRKHQFLGKRLPELRAPAAVGVPA